jgi:plasmid rolling circle replication initiator protein Rep
MPVLMNTDYNRVLTEIIRWAEQQTRRSKLQRTWRKADDLEDLRKWRQRLDDVFQSFMVRNPSSLLAHYLSSPD